MAVVPASCELPNVESAPVESSVTSEADSTARSLSASCSELIDTTPRGLACLHCMHPNAKEQRKVIAQIMQDSCLKNLATNFLVDGTFSFDPSAVSEFVDLLSLNGRQLFLTFFLSNGPSQRRWKTTKVNGFATNISPEVFREATTSDFKLQQAYQDIVKRMIPVMRYAISKGAKIQIIPALEDNLDDSSFQKLSDLTLDVIPSGMMVSLGRNPCRRCYLGNTSSIPNGYFHEVHTSDASHVIADGVITNDGINVSLDKLVAARDESSKKNSQFVLWDRKRQGIPIDMKTYPEVDQRTYQIPDQLEQKEILNFLRGN